MDLALTEEQEQLKAATRGLLETVCTKEWLDGIEAREEYPFGLHQQMADMGLFGIGVPECAGGSGGGMVELALVCEEIGRIGGSVVMTYAPTAVFGNQVLVASGSAKQRARFLPRMAAGRLRTAFALTEPEAGSDVGAVRTRAVPDGEGFVLNGSKVFCSGAAVADYLLVVARTGPADSGRRGLTVFLVDARSPGLTITAIPKLGHHAVQTCEIGIADVPVPADAVVGEIGGGWDVVIRALDAERICTAGFCVGLAQRCVDMALGYGLERRQFGRPVATFQAIAHMLAEMETETAAARWLTLDSAWRRDRDWPAPSPPPWPRLTPPNAPPGRPPGHADPRRVRLHEGVRDGALLPGSQALRGRRRLHSDPAQHHRPGDGHSSRQLTSSGAPASKEGYP